MNRDPLGTTDWEVPTRPPEVVAALRDMADGDDDYTGRLLMVAALYVEAFSKIPEAVNAARLLEEAERMAHQGDR